MDVGIGEAGQDAAAAEVDVLRACEGGLVRADSAGDEVARNGQSTNKREPRLHRADHSVFQDHPRDSRGHQRRETSARLMPFAKDMNALVILLLLVVMLAVASFWPTSD
jgi:hypothetical protein